MKKTYLLTPGPTQIPPEVLSTQARPIIHHRTKEYMDLFDEVNEDLKYLFQTKNIVLSFAASGTGAMESSVVNIFSPDEKALFVRGGKFGERWGEICEAYGIQSIPIDVEWGDVVNPEVIDKHLQKDPEIKAVYTSHCETSTGVLTDIQAIGEIVSKTPTLLVVDAVSALGACELRTDDWSVDLCVSGSQKGMMLPPGLSFVSVSEKAWKAVETSTLPKYYWDYRSAKKMLDKSQTPFTPSVSLIVGLKAALKLIKEEGMEMILKRHERLAEATRSAVKSLGLKLFSKVPANAVTAIVMPEGVDAEKVRGVMDKKFGIKVAGGQEKLKGKIIRIAHLGYVETFDILASISALEMSLSNVGYPVELGKGVRAAQEVLCREEVE
ncbi:alanine--glyoxylate aminotransferase family protein [candidate division TA06 bacterium]|nr:alanine--glyoxylate aminotransferase family protein [candidate division TA06 bacterium]